MEDLAANENAPTKLVESNSQQQPTEKQKVWMKFDLSANFDNNKKNVLNVALTGGVEVH